MEGTAPRSFSQSGAGGQSQSETCLFLVTSVFLGHWLPIIQFLSHPKTGACLFAHLCECDVFPVSGSVFLCVP